MCVRNSTLLKLVFSTVLAVVLAGCGGKKEEGAAPTQVVAKVNGSEISVHQLNAVLGNKQFPSEEAAQQARSQALEKLIDQQLTYDQAVAKKLDRSPEVVMAIESMKREIISRAYLEQILSSLSKPSSQEIREYYNANPALFSKRKIYSLQELAVEPKADLLAQLKEKVATASSLEEIAEWLKAEDVQFRSNAANRSAEQIGLDLLPQVAALEDGQMTVFQGPNNYLVVRVMASQLQPVPEDAAQAKIAQFLHNMKVQETVTGEVRRLKDSATIEYVGDIKPVPAEKAGSAEDVSDLNVEKGMQGLQ